MSATKRMFNEMREQERDDRHLDDEYHFNKWMESIYQKQNHNSNSAKEMLDDLFKSFGVIFSEYNLKKEQSNERESV